MSTDILFVLCSGVMASKDPRQTLGISAETPAGNVSPFAGGKAFPANMDADTMTLAAGQYTTTLYDITVQITTVRVEEIFV